MIILKELIWIGSSRVDLKSLPNEVQNEMGYGLYQAQLGHHPHYAKLLKGFNGVIEIVSDFNTNTYRAVYAAKIDKRLYVLHVFQKKSKKGIKTPKKAIDLIMKRLHTAMTISRGFHEKDYEK